MKFRLSFLFICFLSISVLSSDWKLIEKNKIVETASLISKEAYPNSDSVLVYDYESVFYKKDGTSGKTDEIYEKILTEKGKRKEKEINFYFTLPYSEIKIDFCEIIKADGSLIPVNIKSNTKEMVNSSQMNQNIYNPNSKIMVLTIPNLQVGDLIHYKYEKKTVKARIPNTWSDLFVFEYTAPIKNYFLEINAPAEKPLKNIALKDPVDDTVSFSKEKKNDRIIYKWHLADVHRTFKEPSMPPLYTVVQRLLVSTISNWENISKWYWNLCKPRLEATSPEMKKKVDSLISAKESRRDKIRAIFNFVSQKIRYMGITTEKVAPGYEPHDVNITFENRYGVCRDKAALLVAMLRLAGFKAYPVLIHNGPKKDEDVPQPFFNHAIVAVENPDKSYILMDPTDENTRELFPSYLCNQSYLVAKPEGETLKTSPIVPAEENLVIINSNGKVSSDGKIQFDLDIQFQGINDGSYRNYLSRIKPERRKMFIEKVLKTAVSGAEIRKVRIFPENLRNTDEALSFEISLSADNFVIEDENTIIVKPLWLGAYFGIVNFVLGNAGLEKRRFIFKNDIACGYKEKFSLDIKDIAGKCELIPEYKPVEIEKLSRKSKLNFEDGILSGESEFLIKDVEFTPEEYLQLKKALEQIQYNNRKVPVFSKKKISRKKLIENADSLIINDEIILNYSERKNWEFIRNIKQKILSYAGKKDNSEKIFSYVPEFENIEIISASVTLPDGTVKKIEKDEINLMDASWLASAPRYPNVKKLVLSMPGVDIGSVINLKYKQTVKNRPFFCLSSLFKSTYPYLNKKLTVKSKFKLNDIFISDDNINYTENKINNEYVYTFRNSCIKEIRQESKLPPWWSYLPYAFLSDGKWETYCSELSSIINKRSQSGKVNKKASEIISGSKSKVDKIIKIRNYIEKNIRTIPVSFTSFPLESISDAETVLDDGYGHRMDKAVLYMSMLKSVNLKPKLILVSNTPAVKNFDRLIDNPSFKAPFTIPLIKLKTQDKNIFLNDESQNQYAFPGTLSYAGRPAISIDDASIARLIVPDNLKNRNNINYKIAINSDGSAEIQKNIRYFGTEYNSAKQFFSEMTPEKRKRYFQTAVSNISQGAEAISDLKTDFDEYPGLESMKVQVKKFAVFEKKYILFKLFETLSGLINLDSDTRENPFYIKNKSRRTIEYEIHIPGNYSSILMHPENFFMNMPSESGFVSVKSRIQEKNQKKLLKIIFESKLNPALIPARNYEKLLYISKKLSHPINKTILIKKEEQTNSENN